MDRPRLQVGTGSATVEIVSAAVAAPNAGAPAGAVVPAPQSPQTREATAAGPRGEARPGPARESAAGVSRAYAPEPARPSGPAPGGDPRGR